VPTASEGLRLLTSFISFEVQYIYENTEELADVRFLRQSCSVYFNLCDFKQQTRNFMFCDRASLCHLVNKANLVHNFLSIFISFFLHVSGDHVAFIRRNNYIYATFGICHCVCG